MIVKVGTDDPTGAKLRELTAKKKSTRLTLAEETQLSTLEARSRGREAGSDVVLVGSDKT
jgi:hypothetical protein